MGVLYFLTLKKCKIGGRSILGQYGVNTGSIRGQYGVNTGSIWGQYGVNTGSASSTFSWQLTPKI